MKVRVLKLSTAALVGLFSDGEHRYTLSNPLPHDAQVIRVQHSPQVGILDVWITSDAFEETPIGKEPPAHVIIASSV